MAKKLAKYKEKRDFSITPEPKGKVQTSKKPIFIVQKHAASRLHYDFRLENEGVLLSWAVPKGPSMNPNDKRLAVHVEDHPLEYSDFEGTIPKRQYGGGTVMLWDKGTYENETHKYGEKISLSKGMQFGHVTVKLNGKKLKGIFTVVKTKNLQNQWLFFKKKDEFANEENVLKKDLSVKTGRSMDEISKGKQKWSSLKEDSKISLDFISKKHEVEFTNTNKILFPKSNITKEDFIEYYYKISDYILPHLQDRPVSMLRFPDGINGEHFFQKDSPKYFPQWIKKVNVPKHDGSTNYTICNDLRTLLYLANQVIVPHTWSSRIDKLDYPDKMIFDLDPQKEDAKKDVCEGARILKDIMDDIDIKSFIMSTGSKGLHVVVPLDKKLNYDKISSFARVIAKHLERHDPKRFTAQQRKDKRIGSVFVDTYRNAFSQTAVTPYSVRTIENAPVAAPIDWSELKNFDPQKYNIKNIFKRLKEKGDPWEGFHNLKQSLKKALG